MMKKTNAKRILAAALAGMMALSLSACGEQGGGSPTEGATTESASTAAVAAETKAEAGSAAEPQDSGKTGEEATGGTARPEAQAVRRLCPRRIGRPCRRSLPSEQH